MSPNEMISRCLSEAQKELSRITCYGDKPSPDLAYTRYEYVNGEFMEETEGDRGEITRKTVADTPEKFIEYLLGTAIRRFAFSYECHHRRPFEDNRRQVNEIITNCFACLDGEYEYTLMGNLKDNIHIYFDLLDYYVKVSKEYFEKHSVSGEVKRRLTFLATKQYAGKSGGMYDVAFSFEWVRYQIARILDAEGAPEMVETSLKEAFRQYENQYKRLLELEKADPDSPEKYQLGMWDEEIFAGAEEILSGLAGTVCCPISDCGSRYQFKGMTAAYMAQKRTAEGQTKRGFVGGAAVSVDAPEAYKCAFYMLLVLIHTRRNVEQDVDRLLELAETMDIAPFKVQLEELFVTDKYGVFHRGEYAESREKARNRLGI